jgi:hypothetical protein
MTDDRLRIELDYGLGRAADVFEWQSYMPNQICALAGAIDLKPRLVCTGFDSARPASEEHPRM